MTKSSNRGQFLEAHCGWRRLTTRQSPLMKDISLRPLLGLKSVERDKVIPWGADLWGYPSQWQYGPKMFLLCNDTALQPPHCLVAYHSQFLDPWYHPFPGLPLLPLVTLTSFPRTPTSRVMQTRHITTVLTTTLAISSVALELAS